MATIALAARSALNLALRCRFFRMVSGMGLVSKRLKAEKRSKRGEIENPTGNMEGNGKKKHTR